MGQSNADSPERGIPLDKGSGRTVVFTRGDAQTFVDQLRENFDYRLVFTENRWGRGLPHGSAFDDLADIDHSDSSARILMVDDAWKPTRLEGSLLDPFFFYPLLEIKLGWSWPVPFSPRETLNLRHVSHIPDRFVSVMYRSGDEKLKNRVMRCVAKVCESTRVEMRWPSYQPTAGRCDIWIGADAGAWCRGSRSRMLAMRHIVGGSIGCLPADVAAMRLEAVRNAWSSLLMRWLKSERQ